MLVRSGNVPRSKPMPPNLVLNIQESVVGNGFFLPGFGLGEASDTI